VVESAVGGLFPGFWGRDMHVLLRAVLGLERSVVRR
jgi:hypothetical protein